MRTGSTERGEQANRVVDASVGTDSFTLGPPSFTVLRNTHLTILAQTRRRVGSIRRSVFQCVSFAGTLLLVASSLLAAQLATVGGTVLADSSEKVLAQAEVAIPLLGRSTRTDSVGNFLLTGIKPGRQRFRIRLLGYEPLESWLMMGDKQKLEADFLLKPLATRLGTVVVKTDARPMTTVRAQEFAENEKGPGRFIKADVFEKEQGRNLTGQISGNWSRLRHDCDLDEIAPLAASGAQGTLPLPCCPVVQW